MWVVRRRAELLLLFFAAIPLAVGLRLPPPVAEAYVVSGPVRRLDTGGDKRNLEFSVGNKRFSAHWLEPGYREMRRKIREGAHAQVVGWSYLDAEDSVLEMSLDGDAIGSPSARQTVNWVRSMVFIALGAGIVWFVIKTLRSQETFLERAKRNRKLLEERRQQRQT